MFILVYIHVYVYMYLYVYMYTSEHVCVSSCMLILHTHVYLYTCVFVCIYVYVNVSEQVCSSSRIKGFHHPRIKAKMKLESSTHAHGCPFIPSATWYRDMGWLRFVGSLKF